jgi:hypothetical protein
MLRNSNKHLNNEHNNAVNESDSELSTFRIYPLEDFSPCYPKLSGTRPGCLGKMSGSESTQMLKIEDFAYPLSCTNDMDESVAMESLSSHLIRTIFGSGYAAVVDLIEINGSKTNPVMIQFDYLPSKKSQKNVTHKIAVNSKYAVLSQWDEHTESLYNFEFGRTRPATRQEMEFAIQITHIQTIARLINMDDYKPENIVRRRDGSVFLVDCAANFCGFQWVKELLHPKFMIHNLGHYFIKEAALQIIRQFSACNPDEAIIKILDQFSMVLSSKTRESLLDNILKTQKSCKELLLVQKQMDDENLFFSRKNNDSDKPDMDMPLEKKSLDFFLI